MIRRFPRVHPIPLAVFALAIAAAAGIAIAAAVGFDRTADTLARVHPAWLAVVAAAQFVGLLGYALTYRVVGALGEPFRLPPPLALRLVAAGFGAFTVRGGFALDYRALCGTGVSEGRGRIRVLTLGVLEYVVLAPAACVCAVLLLVEGTRIHGAILWPWVIGVPVGFAFAVAVVSRYRGRRLPQRIDEFLNALAVWRHVRSEPVRSLEAAAGMAVYWGAEILSLWAALKTFGAAVAFPAIVVAYATGYAATRRTLPLGGAGATEALMTFALHWAGVNLAVAFAGMVVYRFFNFVLVTPPALQASAWLQRELPLRGGLAAEAADG
jgi:uncharacterized membrane protein YbhN (UPF0104 family)